MTHNSLSLICLLVSSNLLAMQQQRFEKKAASNIQASKPELVFKGETSSLRPVTEDEKNKKKCTHCLFYLCCPCVACYYKCMRK